MIVVAMAAVTEEADVRAMEVLAASDHEVNCPRLITYLQMLTLARQTKATTMMSAITSEDRQHERATKSRSPLASVATSYTLVKRLYRPANKIIVQHSVETLRTTSTMTKCAATCSTLSLL